MKDDYLWDRSGDDAEIKRLEEMLAVFRYTEAAAPIFSEAKAPRKGLSAWRPAFAPAFGAGLAVAAVVAAGLWFWQSDNSPEPETNLMAVGNPPEVQKEPASNERERKREVLSRYSSDARVRGLKETEPHRAVHKVSQRGTKMLNQIGRRAETVKLTREERSAYDQVLLALSITGSKLKIVQDKVNGLDDTSPPHNQYR